MFHISNQNCASVLVRLVNFSSIWSDRLKPRKQRYLLASFVQHHLFIPQDVLLMNSTAWQMVTCTQEMSYVTDVAAKYISKAVSFHRSRRLHNEKK